VGHLPYVNAVATCDIVTQVFQVENHSRRLQMAQTLSETDVLANQKLILQNQALILKNQEEIKKNQQTLDLIVKNQEQILAALRR
jgi:hypothetical protein